MRDDEGVVLGILAVLALVALAATAIWTLICAPLPAICFLIVLGFCYAISERLKGA